MTADPTIYEPRPGEDIAKTFRALHAMCIKHRQACSATFNGTEIVAKPGMSVTQMREQWQAARDKRQQMHELSAAGQASRAAQRENELVIAQEEQKGPEEFEVSDTAAWAEWRAANTDGYGAAVIRYAARWAHCMEQKLKEDKKLEDIAEAASHEADVEGITSFMYGAAVTMLAEVWKHGEALRRWHNRDCQLSDEGDKANESGGVLNPAMLKLG